LYIPGSLPHGSSYDLFRGAAPTRKEDDEKVPKEQKGKIKFGKKSYAECMLSKHYINMYRCMCI
jgi:hypothetical protein